jgi:PhnB protein
MPDAPPTTTSGVIPYLHLDGAAGAAELYQKAFGATELFRLPAEDGKRLMHCHLKINGGDVMVSDCFPEHGAGYKTPAGFTLHLQVTDIQAWVKRATAAGLTVTLPVQRMFWGDDFGVLRDSFDVEWSLGETPKS